MGQLVDGKWKDVWYDTKSTNGKFIRQSAAFRSWITADGQAGPTGDGGFKAEHGRYHLYVSLACPWAHRTLIFRKLKGLEEAISLSVVNAYMGAEGWTFEPGDGVIPDTVNNVSRLYKLYTLARPDYTGRVTVPVIWDKQKGTIVSNESSEIIRMFNSAFDDVGALPGNYYPAKLRAEIDALNDKIYSTVNNGVYKAGFATRQAAYEEAVDALFETLDMLEKRLSRQRYLVGSQPTEADWRLFTTLLRFDPVYVGHFKCNRRRLIDYPNLWEYVCDLYQVPGVAETVNLDYIKKHYYQSHTTVNPTGIVPVGPEVDYATPHDRTRFDESQVA
jgi:putative glutathione S-transferase